MCSAGQRNRTTPIRVSIGMRPNASRMRPPSWASSPAVRRSMVGNRSRDTTPERALRSELHRLGLRFRVDARPVPAIPRRADVVLRGDRVAVFLDGCFWHGCPEHFRAPATNTDYWAAKIAGNRARDASTAVLLEAAGWVVVRAWEHEPTTVAARRVVATLIAIRERRPDTGLCVARP
jgi:DNA mismatch endonuclease (patch repair protein)